MTENQNNQKEMNVNVVVDRSFELEEKQREIDELKQTLTILAEKELHKQAKLYNCDATIEAVQAAKTRGSTAPLNFAQTKDYNGNNNDNEAIFESEEDMILSLNKSAKEGSKEAKLTIQKLGKKFLAKPVNLQYEGSIKDLGRKIVKGNNESQTDFDSRLAEYKKRQKWSNLNSIKSDGES